MVTYVKLSKLTWTMEEGLIGEWYKQEGDSVEKGEPICEVETEKTVDEVEAPDAGVLHKIVVPAGSFASINQIIAVIAEPGELLSDLDQLTESAKPAPAVEKPVAAAKIEKPAVKGKVERKKVSPVARKLAEDHGVDLMQITGTGPGGRIVKDDILKIIKESKAQQILPAVERTIPITGIRKVIADRLAISVKTALHVYLTIEVDMTKSVQLLEELRSQIEERIDGHLSYTHFLVRAIAKALEEHPIVNSIVENEQIKILEDINIGVAVGLEEGLIVPVIHNANKKTVPEIATTMKKLIENARQGKLSTKEVSGGTFTISNLGMFGIDLFAPIINPPESAILGVGRIAKKPVVIGNKIAIRSIMTLSLVFDHRVIDGVMAARFLQTIKQMLENPRITNFSFEDP